MMRILSSDWFVLGVGMFMVVVTTAVVGFYKGKRNRREPLSDEDKLLLVPMLISGIWGPLVAAVGAIILGSSSVWVIVTVVFLAYWFVWFCFAWQDAIVDPRRMLH